MAAVLVGSATYNIAGATTSQVLTLPGTVAAGDVVVAVTAADTQGLATAFTGYTQEFNSSNSAPRTTIDIKTLGAAETTATITVETGSTPGTNVAIQVWRGLDYSGGLDGTLASASGGGSMPNPPSYTTVSDNVLRIIVGGLDDDEVAGTVTAPAGFTDLVAEDAAGSSTIMMASAVEATGGTANDPDAFGNGSNDASKAAHFAIPIAGGGSDQDLSPTLVTNTQTFFPVTITLGTLLQTLTPSRVVNAQVFFPATVAIGDGDQTISPSLFTNTQTFYVPTITQGAVDQSLSPSLFTNTQVFYGGTVTVGQPQALSPPFLINNQSFFPATVSPAVFKQLRKRRLPRDDYGGYEGGDLVFRRRWR